MRGSLLLQTAVALGFVVCFSAHAQSPRSSPPKELSVLFIGNSFTYVNDLPGMVEKLSRSPSSPAVIRTQAVTYPGAWLLVHWRQGRAIEHIRKRKWDFVVLQEQSALPIEDRAAMYEYARRFDDEIRKTGARTVLFLTWAYRDRPEMQAGLDRAYFDLAKQIHARVAPVGPAWKIALDDHPALSLHAEDGSHPNVLGTYLAACVFYRAILSTDRPCPAQQNAPFSGDDAERVRAAASKVAASVQ